MLVSCSEPDCEHSRGDLVQQDTKEKVFVEKSVRIINNSGNSYELKGFNFGMNNCSYGTQCKKENHHDDKILDFCGEKQYFYKYDKIILPGQSVDIDLTIKGRWIESEYCNKEFYSMLGKVPEEILYLKTEREFYIGNNLGNSNLFQKRVFHGSISDGVFLQDLEDAKKSIALLSPRV